MTTKYYPIQIPYIFSQSFSQNVNYREETSAQLQNFLICFWEMRPKSAATLVADNIIIADGCIDLVVDFGAQQIGFTGMSKTNFNFKIKLPNHYFGARLKPGAFQALTGLSATAAMDNFLPLESVDQNFAAETFFALPFEKASLFFKNYLAHLIQNCPVDFSLTLFDRYSADVPDSVAKLCQDLKFSIRHCQRLFKEKFGLSPKLVLSILRFQKTLKLLTAHHSPSAVLDATNYYDQPHFINDFKKNIGLTPLELIEKYKT